MFSLRRLFMSQKDFFAEEKTDVLIIHLPKVLNASLEEDFVKNIKLWLVKPYLLHVFDFSGVLEIEHAVYKHIIGYKKSLESVEKKFFSIHLSKELERQITADGLKSTFNLAKSLNDAYKLAGLKTDKPNNVKLNTEFINPFIQATMNTFKTQVGVEIKPLKPFLKKANEQNKEPINLAGVINLTCSHFTGAIVIAFSEQVFLNIYEKMLDEKLDKIDDEVKDGAAELLNIIYGQAKSELNKRNFALEKAIPTVLSGSHIDVYHNPSAIVFVLPFESEAGSFNLEVSLSDD